MEQFDYKVKKLIQQKIEDQKENLLSRSLSSYEQYQYELGKLHALEHLLIDYQELKKKGDRRMSKLIVPSYLKNNDSKKEEKKKEKEPAMERVPQATGWRMVILPYKGVEKTKGGLLLTDKAIEEQQLTTNVGLILSMGSDAYADKNKFPNGPWCKKGDWVVFAKYAGSRVKIEGGEIRILNDDEILAKLKDPKDVLTIY